MNQTSGTFSTSAADMPLTLEMLRAACNLTESALARFMRAKGFDPATGGWIVLPESLRPQFWPFGAPGFVKFSALVKDQAILIQSPPSLLGGRIDR